jgi:hypothetical protein
MRRRSFIALVCALLCVTPALSRAAAPKTVLQAGEVLTGRFVQERHMTGFSSALRTTGRFLLAPGKGLIWRAETPFPVTTVITADGLLQEAGGSESTRLPAAKLPFLTHLYDMLGGALSGDWHALETDFNVAATGSDRTWQVILTPHGAADPIGLRIRSITVTGGQFVDHVQIVKPDGDSDDLTFLAQALSSAPLAADDAAAFAALAR